VTASTMVRTNRWIRGAVGVAAAVAMLALSSGAASAQEGAGISVDPRAGLEFPTGGLAEIHTYGFTGGLGVAFEIHPHINLRGDFDMGILNEKSGVRTPSLTVLHYNAGVEFDFPPPDYQDFPLTFRWNIGAGATSLSGDETFAGAEDIDFSQTYPSINTGVKIGYEVAPTVELFAGGALHLIFADRAESAELYKNTTRQPFGNTWSAPVTLGLKASFQ